MAFKMKRLVVGPLEENCYLVWDDADRSAVVVDPGDEGEHIAGVIEKLGLDVRYIINTHGHLDHIGANGLLKTRLGAPLAIHPEDAPLLEVAAFQGSRLGMEATDGQPAPDVTIDQGDELRAGGLRLKVIHTPGHTGGCVCLYLEEEGVLFTGDTLFAGSVGRTDLPGGSFETLKRSISGKLVPLPDGVKVFPGHGPASTIGEEKLSNPFMMTG
jgi:glyoxylase-like metal-dependent hydrolase (beta-lactamase superfamily II)